MQLLTIPIKVQTSSLRLFIVPQPLFRLLYIILIACVNIQTFPYGSFQHGYGIVKPFLSLQDEMVVRIIGLLGRLASVTKVRRGFAFAEVSHHVDLPSAGRLCVCWTTRSSRYCPRLYQLKLCYNTSALASFNYLNVMHQLFSCLWLAKRDQVWLH